MPRHLVLLLLIPLVTAADNQNWPSWRGPTGSGAAAPFGKTLVSELSQACLLWTSTDPTPDTSVGDALKGRPKAEDGISERAGPNPTPLQ